MQIALDAVVYIILSLSLFALVLAFLPQVEYLSTTLVKPPLKLEKEKAIEKIIEVYLGKTNYTSILLKEELNKTYIEKELQNNGVSLENFSINIEGETNSITVFIEDGEVIING